jgi:enoyl-CoA hydratase/carnithine racemase
VSEPHPLTLRIDGAVAVVTIDRPPVNAFDVDAYRALGAHVDELAGRDDVRAVVLAARPEARCWCGGADLRDFVGMTEADRHERYELINGVVPRLQALELPVIAAITGPAIGIGVLLAAVCDMRIASDEAWFSTPEIDYGLVAGSSRLLNYVGVPEAVVREMAFTGRRVPASEIAALGFLNRIVGPDDVVPTAMELARTIAGKGGAVLRARKRAFVQHESLDWLAAYTLAQGLSGALVEREESRRGVTSFLDGRGGAAGFSDR